MELTKKMAKQSKVDKFITDYCASHGIKLLIDPEIGKDDGLCYPPYKEIHLAQKYTSGKIKLVVFLHEISHITVDNRKNKPYNTFECEFLSWAKAMMLYKKIFGKSFSKSQAEFMLKCMKSYCRSQYEFKKTEYLDEDSE